VPRGEYDRGERKAQTRAALLSAAARVYARRGFAGATLDEVAAEAGFSKGAVYAHFGSKEKLLLALLAEHLAARISEQIALFDRDVTTWERPLRGSERWMKRLDEDPDAFRLFVELWCYAQRDERLRAGVGEGLDLLRATFAGFAEAGAADAGIDGSAAVAEAFAETSVALGIGLSMIKLVDSETKPSALLGTVLGLLIRSLEDSPQARAKLEQAGVRSAARARSAV